MTWERQRAYDYDDGKATGILEGAQQKAVEDARNMLIENISPEIVTKCTGLPIDEVQKLQAELSVNA